VSAQLSGVGQPRFVARYGLAEHGLAGPERQGAAEEVAARIGELDLRTVQLAPENAGFTPGVLRVLL